MTVLGQHVLTKAGKQNKPLRAWLSSWLKTAINADWGSLDEVRRTFPSADGVPLKSGLVITIFNVKGNEYRLLTRIDYDTGIVQALELATHAQYSKNLWKARY